VVVGSSLPPKFPSMSWHPRPAPSIPASRASFNKDCWSCLLGSFRCLPSATASRFAGSDIDSRSEENHRRLTPPQAHDPSAAESRYLEFLGRAFCKQIGPISTHHTPHEPMSVQHNWLCVSNRVYPRQILVLRLHLISDLRQLAARMHHPPI
jgi:hypothetical protein